MECRLLNSDTQEKGTRQGSAHIRPCTQRLARRPIPEATQCPLPPVLGRREQRQNLQPTQPQQYGLRCTGFRASITRRPRTSAQERRRSTKWRAGGGAEEEGRACFCAGVRAACPLPLRRRPFGACSPLRRRTVQRAFPRSQWRAGTQRANGKARNAVCGAASGRQRPGADSRRGSRARRNRGPGPSLRFLPFLSPPFPF